MGVVPVGHEELQMMPGDQLVMHHCPAEMDIVAPNAHQLVLVAHGAGRIGHLDDVAPQEEGRGALRLRAEHLDPPVVPGQRRDGDEPSRLDEVHRFKRQRPNEFGLFTWTDMQGLDVLQGSLPVLPVAKVSRGLEHLGFEEGELPFTDRDQLLRGVRNEFRRQVLEEGLAADRLADDRLFLIGPEARVPGPQRRVIPGQRGVRAPIWHLRPPGEHRVVAVVIAKPLAQRCLERPEGGRRPKGTHGRDGPLRGGLRATAGRIHRLSQVRQCLGRAPRINQFHAAAGLHQVNDRSAERQQRLHLCPEPLLPLHQLGFIVEAGPQKDIVDPGLLPQCREVHLPQCPLPPRHKLPLPVPAQGRMLDMPAPEQGCPVHLVAVHQVPEQA